ncbi:leucine-rich repeat domain-containing protein [Chryseobacterium mucoviscidosis]|uniref:leucine-rich repeat domain-containing protein n=1 Tax=Chryseobacterium mucoviscidosis TaxID=1945581 RepID=UPI0031E1604E
MNDTDAVISALETAFNIKLEELEKWERVSQTEGKSYYDGWRKLYLSNIHFENFSALEPVFETLRYLTLIDCSIGSLQDLHRMKLWCLTLKNCSVSNEKMFDPDHQKVEPSYLYFQNLNLENMDIPHPGFFLPISNHLEYVTFTDCTVGNICELNLFPALYSLDIDNTNFIESADDIQYQRKPDGHFTFLSFDNMKLKDFNSFISISKGLSHLSLYDCEVESLKSVCQFTDLKELYISPDLKINDLSIPDNDLIQFELKQCIILGAGSYDPDEDLIIPDFDVKLLSSIASYIKSLKINSHNLINIPHLKHFTRLNELNFDKCSINLENYSSIAHQIQVIDIDTTKIENQEAFKYFTHLQEIRFTTNYNESENYIDLEKLLPLKHHIKKIYIPDRETVLNVDQLKHFTALEELYTKADSLELAQDILSIESLKDLSLYIAEQTPEITEAVALDLQQLKNIEELSVSVRDNVSFKGIGDLRSLKTLTIDTDFDVENLIALPSLQKLSIEGRVINRLPRLEQIKVLDLQIEEDSEIALLKNFPNVEKLQVRIPEEQKIDICGLEKLRVLVFDCNDLNSIAAFEDLPALEELDLSNCGLTTIFNLDKLTNLKMLNLEENAIESIEGLENLKNLERLNLYDNKISDISLVNKLPKLYQVNIAGNELNEKDVEKQLDKPEIATWYGRPYTPFRIKID